MNILTELQQIGSAQSEARTYTDKRIQEIAQLAVGAITESVPQMVSIDIEANGWLEEADEEAPFRFYRDVPIEDVLAVDLVQLVIADSSLETVGACGLGLVCESTDGGIRVRAADIPSETIHAQACITKLR